MFRRSGYWFADKNMRQSITSRAWPDSEGTGHALVTLEPHVLVRRPDRHRHQVDRVIGHSGPNPNEHPRTPNWREHHSLDRQLLDAVEQGFTLRGVPLARLLLE